MRIQLFVLVAALAAAPAATAAEFTVNDALDGLDASPGDGRCRASGGTCTLRAAVMEANKLDGADTIKVPAGEYLLTIGAAFENDAREGDLDLKGGLRIVGAGASSTRICSAVADRVFQVSSSGRVTISGVTLCGGNMETTSGGAVHNNGVLRLVRTVLRDNYAYENGGAIHNSGRMVLSHSTVTANRASNSAGGVSSTGTILVVNSTISGNRVDDHSLNSGGGMRVHFGGTAELRNVTIANNFIEPNHTGINWGAGLAADPKTKVSITMTIIANNGSVEAVQCEGAITSGGHNLVSDDSCALSGPGDQQDTAAGLGPLADNGGPTPTHAPLAGSAAIDAGSNDGCPKRDQRGVKRPVDGNADGSAVCDIGAVEAAS